MFRRKPYNKHGNKRTTINGIKFMSKMEAAHYVTLLDRQAAGEISNLQLQVRYKFASGIAYVDDFEFDEKLETLAEDVYSYVHRVVDVKGQKTDVYKLKMRLMKHEYGFVPNEVRYTAKQVNDILDQCYIEIPKEK